MVSTLLVCSACPSLPCYCIGRRHLTCMSVNIKLMLDAGHTLRRAPHSATLRSSRLAPARAKSARSRAGASIIWSARPADEHTT